MITPEKHDYILKGAKLALPDYIWPKPIKMDIHIKDGIIYDIGEDLKGNIIETSGIISAGFIDTQVNGGGGVLFNDEPNKQGIETIYNAHAKFGTTSMLPTLISDDIEKIEFAQNSVSASHDGILGIHIEGPFINAIKKGIHDETKFKILNSEYIKKLTRLKTKLTLITLAPELQAKGAIEKLVNNGAIISAGHTNATAEDLMHAIEEGLTGFTHLYNAMSGLSAREPGAIGYALSFPLAYSGIIIDLAHVHPRNVRFAYDCLSARSLMIVTDSMSVVGTNLKEFELYNKRITIENDTCYDENGVLAGSALNMAKAVKNAHEKIGIPLGAALQMASETPARFLGLNDKIGTIKIGYNADLIVLNDDLQVTQTYKNGIRIY